MARIGRLAGAILAETQGTYYLIGDLKEPCDFSKAGFEAPLERNAMETPYVPLRVTGPVTLSAPILRIDLEGEELAKLLAERMVIQRNGSVSERLWNLITRKADGNSISEVDVRWLAEMPPQVWKIVQEGILKCL